MRHTLSVLFETEFNAIPRIVGLFSGRGYSIDSISIGAAEEPGLTRATITTSGDEQIIEQIKAYYSLMLPPDPGPPAEGGQQQSAGAQINPRGDQSNAQR